MTSFPITLDLPILWGDMDALRHVNNARYFAWFEAARIAYFDRLREAIDGSDTPGRDGGASHTPAGLGDVGPILASTSCDYLRPVIYPGTIVVGVKVSEIGRSSLRMEYGIALSTAPDQPCARGTSVVVLVRYATMEKVRVSDEVRAVINALEKATR